MRLKETKYFKNCLATKQLEFGEFFFFEHFVVGEILEETILDYHKAAYLLSTIEEFYQNNVPEYYISNKIFSYSIDPSLWTKIAPRIKTLNYLIIEETPSAKINTTFEKMFFEGPMLKFNSVDDAIRWVEKDAAAKNKSISLNSNSNS